MDGLSFLASPAGVGPTPDEFLLRLLIAWLSGQAIGWFYARSHGALSYSQNFVQSLVLLAMVVCVVLGIVGDSIARAFGLAAALALVRFRTPVKDARDTAFLFLSVAVGMAAGAGQLAIAALATIFVGCAAMWLQFTGYGLRSRAEGLLRFRFSGDETGREVVHAVLRSHCRRYELTAARSAGASGPEELVYDVEVRGSGEDLVRELSGTGLVAGVSLLPQARAGEG